MARERGLTIPTPRAATSSVYGRFQRTYRDDPAAFVHDCFAWRGDDAPTAYQDEILAALPVHRRVSARGPRGLGKTALNAWLLLWFALTRDGEDWKIVSTAGAWRQVTKFAWPEVHKWARRLDWEKIGRGPFSTREELLQLSLKLRTGEAFGVVSDVPDLVEGAHADAIFYIFDESKSIPAATFDAAEGAFSGTGEVFAIADSTPGEPQGRFYDIQRRAPGYEDWWVRRVTLDEAIAAGRISPAWVEQRRKQWGETSQVYQNHVAGEFAAADEDGVIPLAWIEAAHDRWRAWDEAGRPGGETMAAVGVDVSDTGGDRTVLAPRYGDVIGDLRYSSKEETMETAGRVKGILAPHPEARAIVDVIGIGAGVVSRLREMVDRERIYAFSASEHSDATDRTGELGFLNKRAEVWWGMRERLDPSYGPTVALPPDDLLTGDLTAPHWKVTSGGKIQIESKEQIRKRIERSTDAGDAVVQAFAVPPTGPGLPMQWITTDPAFRKSHLPAATPETDEERTARRLAEYLAQQNG